MDVVTRAQSSVVASFHTTVRLLIVTKMPDHLAGQRPVRVDALGRWRGRYPRKAEFDNFSGGLRFHASNDAVTAGLTIGISLTE